jgi:hypothetical protein
MSVVIMAFAVGLALMFMLFALPRARRPSRRRNTAADAPLIATDSSAFSGDASSGCADAGADGGACDGGGH